MISLLRLASKFEFITKKATLKEDYIKRILMGYGDFLGVNEDHAWVTFPGNNKRKVNIVVLRSLIGHGKKILKYGVVSCLRELRHLKKVKHNKDYDKYKNIYENLISFYEENRNNFDRLGDIIEKIIFLFENPYWAGPYGGNLWGNIAKVLLNIYKLIEKSKHLRDSGDFNEEAICLMELMTEINVFEGLAHNTNSIFHNMTEVENIEIDHEVSIDKREIDKREMDKIMDLKELENPDNVINEIIPIINKEKIKKQDPMSPYFERVIEKEYKNIDNTDEIKKIKKTREIRSSIEYLKELILKLKKMKNKVNDFYITRQLDDLTSAVYDFALINFKENFTKHYIEKIDILLYNMENSDLLKIKDNYDNGIIDEDIIDEYIEKLISIINDIIEKLKNIDILKISK